VIHINGRLSRAMRRATIARELLTGLQLRAGTRWSGNWSVIPTLGTAQLLIPSGVLETSSPATIATLCDVPPEMVSMRLADREARLGEAASEQPAALAELPASETTPYDELEQVIDDTAEYTLMMPCRNPSVSPRSD
jgi:hypothetical protein